jgi:hypothetical protein
MRMNILQNAPATSASRARPQADQATRKELLRKEKALAEAAALIILRKKAQVIWGDPEED